MKKTLPMLPLRGKYIFPNTVIHFDVSRSRSVKAIEEAMEHDQMIFLIRSLLEQSLKTNDSLKFAVMTGCMRISKESIFTGLNNL